MRLLRHLREIKRSRPLIVAFLILATAGYLLSTGGIFSTWSGLYPASTSGNAGCQLCHDSTQNFLNGYGQAIHLQAGATASRIQAVADLNSDADPGGFTNIQEINANTQPGWTAGTNTVYNIDTGETSTLTAPTNVGTLDPPTSPPPSAPEIDVAPLALDFGAVTVGNTQTLSTTISNTGNASLTISALTVSGNSDFILNSTTPAAPFDIAAGGNATVQVNYTPGAAGSDSGQLTIASNDSDEASIVVSLSGSGTAPATVCDIDVSPLSLSFGSVQTGQSATLSVSVGNTGTAACNVTALAVSGAGFALNAATPATSFTVQPGAPVTVQVDFSPSGTGASSGSLQVNSDDVDEAAVTVSLSGTGSAAAVCDIAVSPASLAFGTVDVGLSATMSVQVQNQGSAECSLTGLDVTGSGFSLGSAAPSLPAAIAAGGSIAVPVNFAPAGAGAASGSLAVVSTDLAEPSLSVPLSGSGQVPTPGCNITLSASTLDFGSVALGTSAAQNVTLGNSGGTDCSVIALNISGTGFSLGSGAPALPFTVAPGASVAVPVSYTPADTIADSGSLAVGSNDPDQSTVTVALTGTGVAPSPCDVQVSPTTLDFGGVPLGATQTRTTAVTNAGTSNCTISSLGLTGGAEFALGSAVPAPPITLIPGESQDIDVDYTPSGLGADTGTLTIGSDDPGQPAIVVSLTASGVATLPTCDISVAPLSREFGQLAIGSSATLSTTLTNNGMSPCTAGWQFSAGSSADFALAPGGPALPVTIQPGGATTVSVVYAPSNEGGDSGSLQINSNDPEQAVVAVSLQGSATLPRGLVDLAVVKFKVTEKIKLPKNKASSRSREDEDEDEDEDDRRGPSIKAKLLVENRSQSDEPAQATLVGIQNGSEVYRHSLTVQARPQRKKNYRFPSYKPVTAGDIHWTLTIGDASRSDSTATAVTEVRAAGASSKPSKKKEKDEDREDREDEEDEDREDDEDEDREDDDD